MQGIFYSEFDNIAGPQIIYQYPCNCITIEEFDSLSDYIIIDKPLCHRIITVFRPTHTILGYPVCIEDEAYDRNAFLFHIGFVVTSNVSITRYFPILEKLGRFLQTMEKEDHFLSNARTKVRKYFILNYLIFECK